MKIIAIILSVLFLSLSVVPCADAATDFEDGDLIVQQHNDHNASADLCSPFCQCQCCHNHIMVYSNPVLEQSVSIAINAVFIYLDKETSQFTTKYIPPPQA